jgi:ribosomal protein L32
MAKRIEREVEVERTSYLCDKCGMKHETKEDAEQCARIDRMPRIGREKWHEAVYELAMSELQLSPCIKCGHPVVRNHVCTNCDCDEPSGNMDDSDWIDSFYDYKGED